MSIEILNSLLKGKGDGLPLSCRILVWMPFGPLALLGFIQVNSDISQMFSE